jgi:hypothetical protein
MLYQGWAIRCSVMPWDELLEMRREKAQFPETHTGQDDAPPLG